MGSTIFPAPAAGKTRRFLTLTSGTSWTVPTGVEFVNVTLYGGGGSGGGGNNSTSYAVSANGKAGQCVSSTLTTTPGASITYAIGAGGSGVGVNTTGGAGGTTTFTGATSASGGLGGGSSNVTTTGVLGTSAAGFDNGGNGGIGNIGSNGGGAGKIDIEYWV